MLSGIYDIETPKHAWLTFIPMSEAITAILVSDSVHTVYTAALGCWKTVFVFAKNKSVRQRQTEKGTFFYYLSSVFCIYLTVESIYD